MFSRPLADIDRLYTHVAMYQLSINLGSTFSFVFLLRQGLSLTQVFIAIAAILTLRFCLRPLTLYLAPRLGLRRTLIVATFINSAQFLVLPYVDGLDGALLLYIVCTAVGESVYWTTSHAAFAAIGVDGKFGGQIGIRQAIQSAVGVLGPPIGGLLLSFTGPWAAFAIAALARIISATPLLWLSDPMPVAKEAPPCAFAAARFGGLVFFADGWIIMTSAASWAMVVFVALGSRYDAYGSALAVAALMGATAGYLLGKGIDRGHGRRAVAVNLAAGLSVLAAQAFCGTTPAMVVGVMIFAALLGGFSVPAMLTAVYAQSQQSPCSFRYQFVCEGGWDIGGALGCLVCALWLHLGGSLQATILLAAPVLLAQAIVLGRGYGPRPASA